MNRQININKRIYKWYFLYVSVVFFSVTFYSANTCFTVGTTFLQCQIIFQHYRIITVVLLIEPVTCQKYKHKEHGVEDMFSFSLCKKHVFSAEVLFCFDISVTCCDSSGCLHRVLCSVDNTLNKQHLCFFFGTLLLLQYSLSCLLL